MQSIELNKVTVQDHFWKRYMELVRTKVIPYQWDALNDRIEGAEPSCCLKNFQIATGLCNGEFHGTFWQDSDVYKWLEAVSYSLMWHKDEELERIADEVIELIGSAQQADGYLNTYYIINGLEQRFTNLKSNHELYCLGHMIEAATAYYHATKKTQFLNIAINFVTLVDQLFGQEKEKKHGYPGHEVIEMALIKLYEITQDANHLKLAKYFIDERGKEPLYFEAETIHNHNTFAWKDSYMSYQYYQAGIPVRKQQKAEGHAVRGVYLYSAMADVAGKTDDHELMDVCETLWDNLTNCQMYITGAIGSSQYGEAFTYDYDLPNDLIYGETCASIGLIFFAKRMFELTKNSKYTDIMEQALYNTVLGAMAIDGTKFFYVNPLEVLPEASIKDQRFSHVKYQRQKWFGCACCPPNIARLLASISGYAYEQEDNTIFINLFIGGDIESQLSVGNVNIHIETDYPWNETISITIQPEIVTEFTLAIRIPRWCEDYTVSINEVATTGTIEKGYLYLSRIWNPGDTVILTLPMTAKLYSANPRVRQDIGKVAVMRGPLVYCLEEADNGQHLKRVYLPEDPSFHEEFWSDQLNGILALKSKGKILSEEGWEQNPLYQPYSGNHYKDKDLTWIPYFSWTNRSPGEMLVWVNKL